MKILLALDTGVDDALALAYALAHPRVELLGVIAHYGNIAAYTAYRNTKAVLEICGFPNVPVYLGACHPLWASSFVPDSGCQDFHGFNGLGNLDTADYGAGMSTAAALFSPLEYELWRDADARRRYGASVGGYVAGSEYARVAVMHESQIAVTHASQLDGSSSLSSDIPLSLDAQGENLSEGFLLSRGAHAIIGAVRTYGSDVAIVATGPLTDVAAALAAAPEIASSMRLVAMGGALHEPGNCYDGVSEANIIHDPEAASAVLASGADVTMVGLDVTHRCLLSRSAADSWREMRNGLHSESGQARNFLADAASFSIAANAAADPMFADGMPLHDPLAVAAAVDSTYVACLDAPLSVQTVSDPQQNSIRGRLVQAEKQTGSFHTRIAISVDSERFLHDFTQTICR